jgi:peptidyl-prolyl cis-trans isomerase D
MVASDADISNLIHSKKDYNDLIIAKVNGEPIYKKEFDRRVNELKEYEETRRKNAGQQDVAVDEAEIRARVYDQMVNEILLKQEAAKLGIDVSDAELNQMLFENPPEELRRFFVDSTGQMSPENYERYVKILTNPESLYDMLNPQMSEEEKKNFVVQFRQDLYNIISNVRSKLLYDAYVTSINASMGQVSPEFANQIYTNEKSNADAQYIYLSVNTIKNEDVTVTDEEIKNYYDQNKNLFKTRPKRKLKYAVFPRFPSQSDTLKAQDSVAKVNNLFTQITDIAERDSLFTKIFGRSDTSGFVSVNTIDRRYEQYVKEAPDKQVVGPIQLPEGAYFIRVDARRTSNIVDSVKASHILIRAGSNPDSSKKLAEDLIKQARSGANFEILAMQYSSDSMSAIKGGDLGYFKRKTMVKEFEEAAFNGKVDSIYGPVHTQFGYHIIKVTGKQSHDEDEIKLSKALIGPQLSETTIKAIEKDLRNFNKKIEEGAVFEIAAKDFPSAMIVDSVVLLKNKPVNIQSRFFYHQSKYLSDVAFDRKAGSIIEPFIVKQQAYIIAQVTKKLDDKIAPLDEVRTIIQQKLINKKKLEMLKSKIDDVYSKVSSLDSLSLAAIPDIMPSVAQNIKPLSGRGASEAERDAIFIAQAYKQPIGKISEPIKGENGWFIIQVISRTEANQDEYAKEMNNYMERLLNWSSENLNSQWSSQQTDWREKLSSSRWFKQIKELADIDDKRFQFYNDY